MPWRVLATPRSFCRSDGPHLSLLRDRGIEVALRARDQPLKASELAALISGFDGAILGLDECDASVLARADKLKVISRNGVGVDSIDLDAASKREIVVTNAPGTNRTAVAELTLALMLALARGLVDVATRAKSGRWSRPTGWELGGKTLGIVGYGGIGREVAARAHHLGMAVIANDPVWPDDPGPAQPVSLDQLFREAQVISLHAPLLKGTYHLVDARRLSLARPGAILVNTARGGLVDEAALFEALTSGRLAGAAMDVFENEPPSDSPLLALDNFIATSHIGANTTESAARANTLAAHNLLSVLSGEPCPNIVNAEALEVTRSHHA